MWLDAEDRRITEDRRLFVGLLASLVALAWAAIWVWGRSPYARFLAHERLAEESGGGEAGYAVLAFIFVAGWTLMTVAMMLPTSLPLFALFHSLVRPRQDRARLAILLVLGYIGVWASFGGIAHAGDFVLHRVIERAPWLAARPWILEAATLALAGGYQFTPLKYRCLDECRSPLSFITEHWRGRNEARQSFLLGIHHGLFCLGCCWSLMLLMFVVGVGSLGWMLLLGAVMAAEKNLSWGRQISKPLGLGLLASAVAVLLTASMIG